MVLAAFPFISRIEKTAIAESHPNYLVPKSVAKTLCPLMKCCNSLLLRICTGYLNDTSQLSESDVSDDLIDYL